MARAGTGRGSRFCGSLRRVVPGLAFPSLFRELVGAGRKLGGGRWRALLVLGSMGLGAAELASHFYFAQAAPEAEEWMALEPDVRPLLAPDTLIVVSPPWAEPLARQALGDAAMPLAHVARADESRFERALEISILGQRAPQLAGWQLAEERTVGRFQLRSWQNPAPARVLYDFLEHLRPPELSVWTQHEDRRHDCSFGAAAVSNGDLHGHPTFPSPRFSCSPGNEALFVAATVIEDQRYLPRRCIWAHPPKRGGSVWLRFERVPLGTEIRGYGGMPWFFERESKGTDVTLSLYVAGEQLGQAVHADGEGWKQFSFSTARFAGQTQTVELSVSSAQMWQRWFCFQAEAR
jgi:hypothetical protein